MRDELKFNPIPKNIGDYIAYSEESSTGLINKVTRSSNAVEGQEAGTLNQKGYFIVTFMHKKYSNHRIVYFLCTGIDPKEKQIDHKDTNPLNNKIWNLRPATDKQNNDNRKKQGNNTSGVIGVCWDKKNNTWNAFMRRNNIRLNLGCFHKSNKDKATAVRIAAELDPRFKDQEYRHDYNDKHMPSPEMLEWGKQYLEDRIERLNWKEKYNV